MIRTQSQHYAKEPVYFSKIPAMSNFLFPQTQNYQTIFTKISKIEPIEEHEFDFRGVAEVMLQQSTPPVIIPYIPRLHLK